MACRNFDKFGRCLDNDPNAGPEHFPDRSSSRQRTKSPSGGYATDVTSGKGRGYGPKRIPSVLDLMAAHRAGNRKYVRQFLPQLSKRAQQTFERRRSIFDTKRAAKKAQAKQAQANRPAAGGEGGRTSSGGGARPRVRPPVPASGLAQVAQSLGVGMPESMAGTLAGLEYDAPIRDLGMERARQPVQAAQELKDIDHWYDEVLASQETARQRDAGIHKAGVSSLQDATQRIVSSLGGGANEGAGLVGASGLDQVGLLEALGTAQDQYNADMRPLLRAESAGARSRQVAQNRQEGQDIRAKIVDLMGQKGQARSKSLMDVRQYNNQLKQQQFQNELAMQEAELAAEMTGAKLKDMRLSRKLAAKKQVTPTGWAAMSPSEKAAVAADARMSVLEIGPDGQPTGQVRPELRGKVPDVVRSVADAYRQYGLAPISNPQVRAHAFATLRSLGITPNQSWLRPPKKRR